MNLLVAASGSSTAATSWVSASCTPSANALVVLQANTALATSTAPTVIDSVSGCGLTWKAVANNVFDRSGVTQCAGNVWVGMASSPSTGSITFTVPVATAALYSIFEFTDVLNGLSGFDAIGYWQARREVGGTSDAVPLPVGVPAADVVLGMLFTSPGASDTVTPGSGYTEIVDSNSGGAAPNTVIQAQYKNGPAPVSEWSWPTSSDHWVVGMQIRQNGSVPVAWTKA